MGVRDITEFDLTIVGEGFTTLRYTDMMGGAVVSTDISPDSRAREAVVVVKNPLATWRVVPNTMVMEREPRRLGAMPRRRPGRAARLRCEKPPSDAPTDRRRIHSPLS